MSNTVHKIRDVESFINVLETANAQGMHVKLGLFGRSLVVTPLPMKNGVPQDKRISQDQAAVARKLNQLVQRELKKLGQGESVAGLRERHVTQNSGATPVPQAFVGRVGAYDFPAFASTFNAIKLPADATTAQISFHQQLREVADLAQRLEVPSMANWALAAGRALADEGRTPHQRLQLLAELTVPVAKDLGYLTAVMKEQDAHALNDTLAWVTGTDGLAQRSRLPDPALPLTRAGLAAQMQEAGQRLRDEVNNMRSQGHLGGMQDHNLVRLGDLGRDVARICDKDVPPQERLAEAQAMLKTQLSARMPADASPLGLKRMAHDLLALSEHAAWLEQQPVSQSEPDFVSQSEQTRRLQSYEDRKGLERQLNDSLVQLKQLATRHLESHPGDLQLKEFHNWAVSKQDMLLAPKVAGKENQALESLRSAIWDNRKMFGQLLEASRFRLSEADKLAISSMQGQFKPINSFLGANHEPDAKERQWMEALGHGMATALPLTPTDVKALEIDIQDLASQAVGSLVAYARSHNDDSATGQSVVELLSRFASQSLVEKDEARARVRLRELVDVLEPGIGALDTQVQQAASRGDVQLAQTLVRLREQMATAHAAVYPPHAGPALVPVPAELRQEVDRAQLMATRLAAPALTNVVSEPVSASVSAPVSEPVSQPAPNITVGAGGAKAELPSNTIEASKELTSALSNAADLFSKFGHGKLRKVYGETIQSALRLLTENTHQAPAADRLAMARGLFDPLREHMLHDLGPRGVGKSEKAVILPLLQALDRSRL